jgi:hypothetical protein
MNGGRQTSPPEGIKCTATVFIGEKQQSRHVFYRFAMSEVVQSLIRYIVALENQGKCPRNSFSILTSEQV